MGEIKKLSHKDEETLLTTEIKELGAHETGWFCHCLPKRYLIALLTFGGLLNAFAMRVNLSVAIVDMVANKTAFDSNGTEYVLREADLYWDPAAQAMALSSFYYGYIVTQIPGGYLAARFGGKIVFGTGILVNALLTLITPAAARTNVYLMITLRIFIGLFQGMIYSSLYAIWSKWAPPHERSVLTAISNAGSTSGTVLTMAVSGLIAHYLNWDWVFYFFGMFAALWCIFWFAFITDSPKDHPNISIKERDYIMSSLIFDGTEHKVTCIPWRKMLTSAPVWAFTIAHITSQAGMYTMLTQLPTYIKRVLGFSLRDTGVLSAVPFVAMVIVMQAVAVLADHIRKRKYISMRFLRILINSVGFLSQALFLIAVGHTSNRNMTIAGFTLAVGMGGFLYSGYMVSHLDFAPRHASILFGFANCLATIPGFLSPKIVSLLTPNDTHEEWRIVFFLTAGVYGFGMIVFAVFSSDRRQEWDTYKEEHLK